MTYVKCVSVVGAAACSIVLTAMLASAGDHEEGKTDLMSVLRLTVAQDAAPPTGKYAYPYVGSGIVEMDGKDGLWRFCHEMKYQLLPLKYLDTVVYQGVKHFRYIGKLPGGDSVEILLSTRPYGGSHWVCTMIEGEVAIWHQAERCKK